MSNRIVDPTIIPPSRYELMVKILTKHYDEYPGKLKEILISEALFPYEGYFMGVQIRPIRDWIVDEHGRQHAVIFIHERRY